MDPTKQRGFLNNNPGNMDRAQGGEPWQGEIRSTTDNRLTPFQRLELINGRFCVFVSPQWGIRATAKNLFAYADRLGICTVRGFISKWAPPGENDTAAYIASVAAKLGVHPDKPIDIRTYATLYAIIDAIIRVECGGMPYTGSEIEDGLKLAGVVKPVGVTTSRTAAAGAVSSGATVTSVVVSSCQEPLQQFADTLAPMAGTIRLVDNILLGIKIALGVIALIGVVVMIYERVKRAKTDKSIDFNPTVVGV